MIQKQTIATASRSNPSTNAMPETATTNGIAMTIASMTATITAGKSTMRTAA
ncbi:hypothetical protein JJC00_15695 [Bradyrhizobium diazoefficiens]|uniref:hypothetical protein n=1 Tax=Bradyrhizobium diazoefficiens TaxID=1355477 RepID=UPI001909FABF|nr:hypothetical protein [Bradyrhizobium diazoefficiens]QQO36906.1 hypothetical protein JJC00_15695 [Bradyrhizobium diazoefficiens]